MIVESLKIWIWLLHMLGDWLKSFLVTSFSSTRSKSKAKCTLNYNNFSPDFSHALSQLQVCHCRKFWLVHCAVSSYNYCDWSDCNCWMYQWTFIAIMQLQDNKFDPSILSNLCLCSNELLILQVNHSFHNFLKVSALNLQVYFGQDSSN